MLIQSGMTTLANAWDAISPTPVHKGNLIEPEATDRFEPKPWFHLPPGALALMTGLSLATAAATLQTSYGDVQRGGLPAVLPEGLPEALPRVLPARFSKALEAPLARHLANKTEAGQKRHRTRGKLHRVLRDEKRTEWSRAG
jgi:hypothetical protein